MKIFISVDMEGTTGVERVEEIFRGLPGFDLFRKVMAGDTNAVVLGAIEGGATHVTVSDSHGYMCNINPDDLVDGVYLRRGLLNRSWCQAKGLDSSYDAVIMIGYHAKSGTPNGILSHTWIPSFRDVRVNGQSVPEPSLNALLAGEMGVPVIMLSGDNMVAIEASPVLGDIEYVELKESITTSKGRHKPIDEARRLLRAAAKRAVASARQRTPTTLKGPVTIEVDVSSDAVNDPAMGQRLKDNLTFLDSAFSDEEASKPMSDFELILRNNPDLKGSKDGTIVIETANFTDGYVALHRALGSIYERDIENMIDLGADVQGYARDDIVNVLGDDYPITEIR